MCVLHDFYTQLRDSNGYRLFRHRYVLRKLKLRAKERNNPKIIRPTMLWVIAFVLAVVCKRTQQLPTLLGPAVHRRGKDTDLKDFVNSKKTMFNARAWPQQRWKCCHMHYITDLTLLGYASVITEQKKSWELLVSKFDWCQTLHNNSQQHATTCNRVCKRTQNVKLSILHRFERSLRHFTNTIGAIQARRLTQGCINLLILHPVWRNRDRNCQV